MPDPTLRSALLDHAAACDAAGMPKCARIAARLASGRPPVGGDGERDPEVLALLSLVEVFGADPARRRA